MLHFTVQKGPETSKTPPIVILHGLFGSSDNWKVVATHLSKLSDCYCIDLRNHGDSPHFPTHTYNDQAQDLKKTIEKVTTKKIILIGHSMGGKTAIQFTHNYPNIVDKLIILDIAPKKYPRQHDDIFEAMNSIPLKDLISRMDAFPLLEKKLKNTPLSQFLVKNIKRKVDQLEWKFNLSILEKDYSKISEKPLLTNKINQGTLILYGNKSDYIHPKKDIDLLNSTFNKFKLKEIQNAGHWLHAEQPKTVISEIEQFIQR